MLGLKASLAAAAFMLLCGSAFADPAWLVLEEFGLTGTWARSCKAEPDGFWNFRQTFYRDRNGNARVKVDMGSGGVAEYAVDGARLLTPTKIELTNRNDDPEWGSRNGRVFHVVFIKGGHRIRTFESTDDEGTEIAKDGVYIFNRKKTPWIEKCRD